MGNHIRARRLGAATNDREEAAQIAAAMQMSLAMQDPCFIDESKAAASKTPKHTWISEDAQKGAATRPRECSICLEPMWRGAVGVPVNNSSTRVCRHTFHVHCLEQALGTTQTRSCPTCRAVSSHAATMPAPDEDGKKWLKMACADGEKKLLPEQVADALQSHVDIDEEAVIDIIREHWHRWDAGPQHPLDQEAEGALCNGNISVFAAFVKELREGKHPKTPQVVNT